MPKDLITVTRIMLFCGCFLLAHRAHSQNIQLHYDLRHTLEPAVNKSNFLSFSFEYFKNIDTLNHGSFLVKLQADLTGQQSNVGQAFTQVTQTLRFWKPKVFLSANYSGGLGVTPDGYGFYLSTTLGAGISYPFQWQGAWFTTSLLYRYTAFTSPSYDPQLTIYFGRGFFHYKVFAAGSFVSWTENRNQGNSYTAQLRGKKCAFFGDPQLWFNVKKNFAVGTRLNVYYHLLGDTNALQAYPTIGTKYQF